MGFFFKFEIIFLVSLECMVWVFCFLDLEFRDFFFGRFVVFFVKDVCRFSFLVFYFVVLFFLLGFWGIV